MRPEAALLAKGADNCRPTVRGRDDCDVIEMQIQNTGRYWKPSTRKSQEAA